MNMQVRPPVFTWTEQSVATLVEMANANKSSSVVADLLGTTRSSVLAKASRLGVAFKSIQCTRRRRGSYFIWNENAIERLREYSAQKLGSDRIARKLSEEFGMKVEAGAVRTKAANLGIEVGGGRAYQRAGWQAKGLFDEKRVPKMRAALGSYTPVDPGNIATVGVSLTDLGMASCRYPIGDPMDSNFSFCGSQKAPASPYCAGHHQLCYRGK